MTNISFRKDQQEVIIIKGTKEYGVFTLKEVKDNVCQKVYLQILEGDATCGGCKKEKCIVNNL